MRIKITKCHDDLLWYDQYVGWVFDSYRQYEDSFLVRAIDGFSNIVYKCDAEILETTKEV